MTFAYFLIKHFEKNTPKGIRMSYSTSVYYGIEQKAREAFDMAVDSGLYRKIVMVGFDTEDPEKKCVTDMWQSMDVPMPEDHPFGEGERFIDRCVCGSVPKVSNGKGASYSMYRIECPKCGRFVLTKPFKLAVNGWNRHMADVRGLE